MKRKDNAPKPKDGNGRVPKTGESQRKDGNCEYRYTGKDRKPEKYLSAMGRFEPRRTDQAMPPYTTVCKGFVPFVLPAYYF